MARKKKSSGKAPKNLAYVTEVKKVAAEKGIKYNEAQKIVSKYWKKKDKSGAALDKAIKVGDAIGFIANQAKDDVKEQAQKVALKVATRNADLSDSEQELAMNVVEQYVNKEATEEICDDKKARGGKAGYKIIWKDGTETYQDKDGAIITRAKGGNVSNIDTIYVKGKYRNDGSDFYENQETNDVGYVVENFRNDDRGLSVYRIYIRFNDGTEREITKDDYAKGGELEPKMQYGSWYVKIYEDENDEEIRNEEVARLIREGYTSGFEPRWYLEITDIDEDIDYATEQHIAKMVEDGYTSGEVVMYEEDYAKGGDVMAARGTRIANRDSRIWTRDLADFRGNNLAGKWMPNDTYVVLSYGYYPLYVWEDGTWYENSEKYSVSTSKQQTQSRPTYSTIMKTTDELNEMTSGNPYANKADNYAKGGELKPSLRPTRAELNRFMQLDVVDAQKYILGQKDLVIQKLKGEMDKIYKLVDEYRNFTGDWEIKDSILGDIQEISEENSYAKGGKLEPKLHPTHAEVLRVTQMSDEDANDWLIGHKNLVIAELKDKMREIFKLAQIPRERNLDEIQMIANSSRFAKGGKTKKYNRKKYNR